MERLGREIRSVNRTVIRGEFRHEATPMKSGDRVLLTWTDRRIAVSCSSCQRIARESSRWVVPCDRHATSVSQCPNAMKKQF